MRTIFKLLLCCIWVIPATAKPTAKLVLELYPGSGNGMFYLQVFHSTSATVVLYVNNMLGQEKYRDTVGLNPETNVIALDLRFLPSGKYLVNAVAQDFDFTKPVIIESATSLRYVSADSVDILHTDINMTIRNLSLKTVDATATQRVCFKKDSVKTITFQLLKFNVSNAYHGVVPLTFVRTDSTVTVFLDQPGRFRDTFDISIRYDGVPATDPSWGGFYFNGDYAYTMGVGFKSYPHSFGRCWFPCFDDFRERATYRFHITTDSGWKAVCNGLPQPEQQNPDGSYTWHWQLSDPIPAYLASVAVGKYTFLQSTYHGHNRDIPVLLAVEAKDTAKARLSFTRLTNALFCFEEKFGPYPFERIGYVGVPFNSGAMEHATNIAYPNYAIDGTANYETLFAHELSHMWWGDQVTCRTEQDMWLNEGWASFCEAVFEECVSGTGVYHSNLQGKKEEVLLNGAKSDGGFYPVSGIPATITYGTHVYKKGAVVTGVLRELMGDSAFFAACRYYQQGFAFRDASSEDLKRTFQQFTAVDLDNFFSNWIYNPGFEDIAVVDTFSNTGLHTFCLVFTKLRRLRPSFTTALPLTVRLYLKGGASEDHRVLLNNVQDTFVFSTNGGAKEIVNYRIDPNQELGLGFTERTYTLSATGSLAMPEVLASLNVQDIGPGTSLNVRHHWVEPYQGNLRLKGIRISTSRYWQFDGPFPTGFKTWAFFNYSGNAGDFLDFDFLKDLQTEDSLVLLHRPGPGRDWNVFTDYTHQPGTDKTDKTGRFWVTALQPGEYAIGIRDVKVTGLKLAFKEEEATLGAYPNPAGNRITVVIPDIRYTGLRVTDSTGKLVLLVPASGARAVHLDVSGLKPGVYFVETTGSEQVMKAKFVVSY